MAKNTPETRSNSRLVFLCLLLLVVAFGSFAKFWVSKSLGRRSVSGRPGLTVEALERQAREALALEATENQRRNDVWAPALAAQRYDDALHEMMDEWNGGASSFPFLANIRDPIASGVSQGSQESLVGELPFGIRYQAQGIREALRELQRTRHRVDRWRWNQVGFRPSTSTTPASSEIELTAELSSLVLTNRALLRGMVEGLWTPETVGALPTLASVQWKWVGLWQRTGALLFQESLRVPIALRPGSYFIDPLLVCETDAKSGVEIHLLGANVVFRRKKGDRPEWESQRWLTRLPAGGVLAGAFADGDGDGLVDLWCAGQDGLWVYRGLPNGKWETQGQHRWVSSSQLRHPQVLSLGDMDGDGDLDVFLGQYKLPYQGGQFPTPYYDSHDGFPSFILRNEGQGQFREITQDTRIHRQRRVYSASWFPFAGDSKSDLVVVSDFSGIDFWTRRGAEDWKNSSDAWKNDRLGFGMAHGIFDFDRDGRLDLGMVGMDSPVAKTLDGLGLGRVDQPDYTRNRSAMTYGNRFFLADSRGELRPSEIPDLTHSGWAWAMAELDVGNRGQNDYYFVNGHETFPSAKDHEWQFWLHDIYVGRSTNNPVAEVYFKSAAGRRRAERRSYGGWQANPLFLRHGAHWFEAGFLLGVAVPEDCRNLVATDVDGDGRTDLVMTTFESWPQLQQQLIVLSQSDSGLKDGENAWIGWKLGAEVRSRVESGGRLECLTDRGLRVHGWATGDGFRSQGPMSASFGLGRSGTVVEATLVDRLGNRRKLISEPTGQWHWVARW